MTSYIFNLLFINVDLKRQIYKAIHSKFIAGYFRLTVVIVGTFKKNKP